MIIVSYVVDGENLSSWNLQLHVELACLCPEENQLPSAGYDEYSCYRRMAGGEGLSPKLTSLFCNDPSPAATSVLQQITTLGVILQSHDPICH